MANDDTLNPSLTFSSVAWSSIVIAVDHLGLADDSLSREGGFRLRPHAFYSLCRVALVAASQAIWVMTGGRDSRLRRLQLIELQELDGQATFLRDYANDESLAESVSAEFLESLTRSEIAVQKRLKTLRSSVKPQRGEYSVTRTLKDAAIHIRHRGEDDPWLMRAYWSEWRLASGTAHARLWQTQFRPHQTIPLIGQGSLLRVSTGTTESYGMSLAAATMATSEALDLWESFSTLTSPRGSGLTP